jgi:hypothetical protein
VICDVVFVICDVVTGVTVIGDVGCWTLNVEWPLSSELSQI